LTNDKPLSELHECLERAGHRPAKRGSRWICTNCPQGKAPALNVDGEVFYCHRCGVGGNVITLRRMLGLETVRPRRTPAQRMLQECARVLAAWVKQWEKAQRRWLCVQHKNAMEREITARDRGNSLLSDRIEVDMATIDEAFKAAQERDWYMQWLDGFDRLTPAQLVTEYLAFQVAVQDSEPIAVVTTKKTSQPIAAETTDAI
jgi:hypothetical protein